MLAQTRGNCSYYQQSPSMLTGHLFYASSIGLKPYVNYPFPLGTAIPSSRDNSCSQLAVKKVATNNLLGSHRKLLALVKEDSLASEAAYSQPLNPVMTSSLGYRTFLHPLPWQPPHTPPPTLQHASLASPEFTYLSDKRHGPQPISLFFSSLLLFQ